MGTNRLTCYSLKEVEGGVGEKRGGFCPQGTVGNYLGTLLVVTLTVSYGHLVGRDPEPYAGLLRNKE